MHKRDAFEQNCNPSSADLCSKFGKKNTILAQQQSMEVDLWWLGHDSGILQSPEYEPLCKPEHDRAKHKAICRTAKARPKCGDETQPTSETHKIIYRRVDDKRNELRLCKKKTQPNLNPAEILTPWMPTEGIKYLKTRKKSHSQFMRNF